MSLTTFSEYYLLGKSQIELDFVNIFVDKNMDLPLFIDPWAINIRSDLLGKKMYNLIQNYFQLILDSIRSGDSLKAIELLSQTKEFKEIKLGHSKGGDGKGMGGGEYAKHLFDRLKKSKAVSTGMLSHIEDTVLIIEGINYDRISDMIGHILKYELIKYTQQQCYLYRIKTYPRSGTEIRNGEERIDLETVELPYHEESGWIILVPKSIVRKREFSINFDKFYNKYILEFEQTKHLEAGSGLCRVLKSGKKREPTKKDLMLKIPKTKETALTYIEKEPQLLDQYKKALNEEKRDENLLKLFDPMEEEDEENIINNLIKELDLLIPGVDNDAYHNIIVGCLLYIFYPYLENPIKEFEINEGKKKNRYING